MDYWVIGRRKLNVREGEKIFWFKGKWESE
jgi:hypothetical protein